MNRIHIEDLDVCAADLLAPEEEHRLARIVRGGLTKASLLVLRSPVAVRELREFDELIAIGEMSPKDLMPRGKRTARELREMRRAVHTVAAASRRKGNREAVYDRIVALDLNEHKVLRMGNRVKELARRRHGGFGMSAKEIAALDAELRKVEGEVEDAKGKLVASNMRLVMSIAKKYNGHSMEFSDLMQEGGLGLMIAITKFDPERGFKFSTYATWWIRQSISRALADKERTVRLPVHVRERAARIKKTQKRYFEATGTDVSMPELARRVRLSAKSIDEILQVTQDPVSLSAAIGSEEAEGDLEQVLADPTTPDQDARLQEEGRKEEVETLLSHLNPREQDVVRSRFGISLDRSCSLSEVGRRYGLSRERVRQIEAQALAKLRHSDDAAAARDYV